MTQPTQYPDKLDPLDDNPEQRTAFHADNNDTGIGVDVALPDQLMLRVMAQRDQFQQFIKGHFMEVILTLRQYANVPRSINTNKLEYFLRQGYDVIVGMNRLNILCVLGTSTRRASQNDPTQYFKYQKLTSQDITWTIPDHLIPTEKLTEITFDDNAMTGDFVVVRNKPFTYVSDFALIETYSHRFAEIQSSRFSLIIQSKISKFLQGDPNNNTLNDIVTQIYSGNPFIKVTEHFNPEIDIIDMSNDHVSDTLRSLKQEYNDEMNELNNLLGINTTGIDKQSGVSDDEVNANNDTVASVSNKYLAGVQSALDLLNTRYTLNMHAYLNQNPSEVTQ